MFKRKFKSPKELERLVDEYFDSCFKEVPQKDGSIKRVPTRPQTITGLAVALGVCRRTLDNYKTYGEEFAEVIQKALNRCENFAEEKLFTQKNVAGIIFSLKNNYGWKDKNETALTDAEGKGLFEKVIIEMVRPSDKES